VHGWVANWRKTHQVRECLGTGTTFVTTGDTEKEKKKKKELTSEEKLTKMKCFCCKEKGHIASSPDCSLKNKKKEEGSQDHQVNATWVDADVLTTYDVFNMTDNSLGLGRDVVLLDTQANISLFHPSILENVKESEKDIKINGIGGYQMMVNKKGYLPNFF
jgi:hypothetical protein